MLFFFSNPYGEPVKVNAMVNNNLYSPVTEQVRANRAIEHIRFLSEKIGPRPSGTMQEHRAAKYIGDTLQKLGYEVESIQTFPGT